MPSPADTVIVGLLVLLPVLYIFRNSLPFINKPASSAAVNVKSKVPEDEGDPSDWVEKMERGVSL